MKESQCSQPKEQRDPAGVRGLGATRAETGSEADQCHLWQASFLSLLWLSPRSGDKAQAGGRSRVVWGNLFYVSLYPSFPFQEATPQSVLTKVGAWEDRRREDGLTLRSYTGDP